ncbi:MAG: hypothetical protein K2M65_02155 [Muribaculaceae bacterium]|nr:hypothetical protein [Muribaculaceae bacterium]
MKPYNLKSLIGALAMAGALGVTGCQENDITVTPEFMIEGTPESIEFTCAASGLTSDGYIKRDPEDENDTNYARRFTVRANTSWHIDIDESSSDWLLVFPREGKGDAYVAVAVNENTRFDPRSCNLTIHIAGQDTPFIIPVNQGGAEASLQVPARVTLTATGGQTNVNIVSNISWTAEKVADEGSEWLKLTGTEESYLTVETSARDVDEPRTARVAVLCPQVPEKNDTITFIQYGPSIIMYEDFESLNYPMSGDAYYSTTGSQRMDAWTDNELSNGWSCWTGTAVVGGTASSNSTVYGVTIHGNSSAKLGRTSVNGNLASPRMAAIGDGNTMDVKVSFQACPYVATGTAKKSSAYDTNRLYVFVYGGGTIEGVNSSVTIGEINHVYNGDWENTFHASDYPDAETAAAAKKAWRKAKPKADMPGKYDAILYNLTNYPNSKYTTIKFYDEPLLNDVANHEFIIRGATANTQVVFQAGEWNDTWSDVANTEIEIVDLKGTTHTVPYAIKCNRVFIDNVIVRDLNAAQ